MLLWKPKPIELVLIYIYIYINIILHMYANKYYITYVCKKILQAKHINK